MKAFSLILFATISHQAFSNEKCIDVSGTYEFRSFKGQECSINDDSIMHLSPLDLGGDISDNSLFILKQNGCKSIQVISKSKYRKEADVKVVDLTKTIFKNGKFEFSEKKSGTVSSFGTLSYSDKTSWTLGLDENKDLKVSFKHRSIGLYNAIIPTWDRVIMNCVLERK